MFGSMWWDGFEWPWWWGAVVMEGGGGGGALVVVVAGAVPVPATGGNVNAFKASSTLTG